MRSFFVTSFPNRREVGCSIQESGDLRIKANHVFDMVWNTQGETDKALVRKIRPLEEASILSESKSKIRSA